MLKGVFNHPSIHPSCINISTYPSLSSLLFVIILSNIKSYDLAQILVLIEGRQANYKDKKRKEGKEGGERKKMEGGNEIGICLRSCLLGKIAKILVLSFSPTPTEMLSYEFIHFYP